MAANGTSAFSAAQTVADLYTVINTNPGGVGSLAQAIINANAHIGSNTISFAITGGSLVIKPTGPLPLPFITDQVTIDGTTQAGVVIDGDGLTQDGLVLGAGSGNSVIKGLTIQNFAGAAIIVQSSDDTIQQNTLGTSGLGNRRGRADRRRLERHRRRRGRRQHDRLQHPAGRPDRLRQPRTTSARTSTSGTNGPNSPVQANDIVLSPGANNNQPSPTLLTTYISGANLVAEVSGVTAGTTVELYQLATAPAQRTFVGSGTVNLVGGILTVSVPRGSIVNGDQIVATATVAANGTSAFSAAQTVADLYTVINTNPSGVGSLAQAIINANAHIGSNTISFAITGGSLVIRPTGPLPLPSITDPVTIDGTTQAGVVIDGNAPDPGRLRARGRLRQQHHQGPDDPELRRRRHHRPVQR